MNTEFPGIDEEEEDYYSAIARMRDENPLPPQPTQEGLLTELIRMYKNESVFGENAAVKAVLNIFTINRRYDPSLKT